MRIEAKPKQCKVCKGPVDQPKVGRTREYCSPACRQRAYERRKGQGKRAFKQAEKEQKRIEALPIYERNMERQNHKPLYEMADGAKLFRCMACGKIYTAKKKMRKKYRDTCSNACYERLRKHDRKFYDALEALSQQNSRASWPIKRRDNEKHSPFAGTAERRTNELRKRADRANTAQAVRQGGLRAVAAGASEPGAVHRFRQCAECGDV
jgi:hypothetical protein